jgi:hypothetical protein
MPPDRGLSNKKQAGFKGKKDRLTYVFTVNADGSEKQEPLVIGKAFKPRAFGNKTGTQLGFKYRNNAKAWMTMDIYQGWLMEWDHDLQQKTPTRRVLLLQDNFSGHVVPDGLKCIRVENFRANLTAHVQPNDAGIIQCFKAHYHRHFYSRAIDRYEQGITPLDVYVINQLEAMRLAGSAWNAVDATTIWNCWHKAGILPDNACLSTVTFPISVPVSMLVDTPTQVLDPITQAEEAVKSTLDELQRLGVLQQSNRMDLEHLLNPIEEQNYMMVELSNQDICDAVLKAMASEDANADNPDDEDEVVVRPRPTRSKALEAISTIQGYVEDIDSPYARKVEDMLASFGRQTRVEGITAAQETKITDFFRKQ